MAARSSREPIRTCVGCRRQFPQAAMIRFVRTEASWSRDPQGKRLPGRGVYLCSERCAEAVVKNKRYPGLASAAREYGLISSSEKSL